MTYDAFLLGLGRMSLSASHSRLPTCTTHDCTADLEAHGGLYVLHSHLNHSCEPNLSVRHLDQRSALARITVLAKRAVPRGEELTITYVDPSLPVAQRRQRLLEWGFGPCECARCVREVEETAEKGLGDEDARGEGAGVMADLEAELKAGLGVV